MCGIMAYLGNKQAGPIILEGLKRLEYRGYDSAGMALIEDDMVIFKKQGKVAELEKLIGADWPDSTIGMGHTRWATHGVPDDINAHPHRSSGKRLAVIHNGIVENYDSLKKALQKLDFSFTSQTDTEVFVNLVEYYMLRDDSDLEAAVFSALKRVEGAYAFVLMDRENPDRLVIAKKQSPIVIGIGEEEFFIASDATPIVQYTKKVIYLEDNEIAIVDRKAGLIIKSIDNKILTKQVMELDLKLEELEKGGYDHFMLKEIFQQPQSVSDCMRGRINSEEGWAVLGGLKEHMDQILEAKRLILLGCGTSWHSALIGKYLMEDLARIPTKVEYASEFRYRNPVIEEGDVVIAISQSGETIDTLAAAKLAKSRGAYVYGIVNVVGSSIARMTDSGSYIHAGPEIGVASTKAFTGQVTLLTLLALILGRKEGNIPPKKYKTYLKALEAIPSQISQVLSIEEQMKFIAAEIKDSQHALYLGRGYNFPVALEGALKLKEISYIHAEGYPAAEMKHGPIALIDENMPVVIVATNDSDYDKVVNNIQEVKSRKGIVISIVNEDDTIVKGISDYTIEIPRTLDALTPLLSVIPLQLLSYHAAVMRDCDVDQPRNLAKSVTVE